MIILSDANAKKKKKKKKKRKRKKEDKEAEGFQISHFYWLFLKWHHDTQGPVKQPLSLSDACVWSRFFRTYKICQARVGDISNEVSGSSPPMSVTSGRVTSFPPFIRMLDSVTTFRTTQHNFANAENFNLLFS